MELLQLVSDYEKFVLETIRKPSLVVSFSKFTIIPSDLTAALLEGFSTNCFYTGSTYLLYTNHFFFSNTKTRNMYNILDILLQITKFILTYFRDDDDGDVHAYATTPKSRS